MPGNGLVAQVLLRTSGFIQSWGYTIQMPAWAPAGFLRPSSRGRVGVFLLGGALEEEGTRLC